jgi:primary-amine oxidase
MRFSTLFIPSSLGHLVLTGALSTGRVERRDLNPGPPKCSSGQPLTNAPHKNFWGALTANETTDVLALLHSNVTGFNLTSAKDAGRYVLKSLYS